ncbi:hypothetical protein N7516_008137, partial [Penicillium verrucosum]|uniref:uncharacterized protein n=1 Tax=Penicillium verrucosum TaxID=60171 RepID=UPI0025455E2D
YVEEKIRPTGEFARGLKYYTILRIFLPKELDNRKALYPNIILERPDYLKANGIKELYIKAIIEVEVFRNNDRSPAEGVALQIPL